MTDAMFLVEDEGSPGGRYQPQPITAGPWSPDAQHGGAVSALLARAVERADPMPDLQTVRLTVELLRPVPLTPLDVRATLARPGRKVRLVEATLRARDVEVARARALQIRTAQIPIAPEADDPPPHLPAEASRVSTRLDSLAFGEAIEFRFVDGSFDEEGPVTVWCRLRNPVVGGEEPSPLQRCAAAADFGNGLSRVVPFETHTFINPDLTVALNRVPRGEWLGMAALTRLSNDGFGQAVSRLFDRSGTVGQAVQSLFVDRR
ncbi:MAG: thioesterase family protein [Acidimicrobiaceae bacterium]|nr:thioesterase family protein [Acidimicrobiaceae bacterium]